MIFILLSTITGAVANRINGGLVDALDDGWCKRTIRRLGSANVMLALFLWMMLLSHPLSWGGLITALLATAGMYAGQSWGLGRYVGATGRWEQRELNEVAFIDRLLARWGLKPQSTSNGVDAKGGKLYRHTPIAKLWQWGFVGLTLRGILWGACIWVAALIAWGLCMILSIWFDGFAVAFPVPWPVLGGALMGVAYSAMIELARVLWRKPSRGWPLSEYAFGAVLWAFCVI